MLVKKFAVAFFGGFQQQIFCIIYIIFIVVRRYERIINFTARFIRYYAERIIGTGVLLVPFKAVIFEKTRFRISERHFVRIVADPRAALGFARKICGDVKIYFRFFVKLNNARVRFIKHKNLGYISIIGINSHYCFV